MKTLLTLLALTLTTFAGDGFVTLFDGKTLAGWAGRPELWSVRDGAICGQTTTANPAKENTFLICTAGDFADFELHAQFKLVPGDAKGFANSGIQFRSKVVKPEYCVVAGYQADMEAGKTHTGSLYEEKGRGQIGPRGNKLVLKDGAKPGKPKPEVVGPLGDVKELEACVKHGDWNDIVIIAKGNHIQQFINGKPSVDFTDETAVGARTGIIALQLHAGPPMQACFRDLKIKKL